MKIILEVHECTRSLVCTRMRIVNAMSIHVIVQSALGMIELKIFIILQFADIIDSCSSGKFSISTSKFQFHEWIHTLVCRTPTAAPFGAAALILALLRDCANF